MSDAELREFAMTQRSCLADYHHGLTTCRQYLSQLMCERTQYEQQIANSEKLLQEQQQRLSVKQERLANLHVLKEQAQLRMSLAASLAGDVEKLKEKCSAKERHLRNVISEVQRLTVQQQKLQQQLNSQVVSVGLLSADINSLTDQISQTDECNVEYEAQLNLKHEKMRQQLKQLEALQQNIAQLKNHQLESNGNQQVDAAVTSGILRQNTNYHSLPLQTKLQTLTGHSAQQNDHRTTSQHCKDVLSTQESDCMAYKDDTEIISADAYRNPSSGNNVDLSVVSGSAFMPLKSAQWGQQMVENIGVGHSENLRNTSYRMLERLALPKADMHQSLKSVTAGLPASVDYSSPFSSSREKSAEITDHLSVTAESVHTRWPLTVSETHKLEQTLQSKDIACPSHQLDADEVDTVTTNTSNQLSRPYVADGHSEHALLPDVIGCLIHNVTSQNDIVSYTISGSAAAAASQSASADTKVPPPVAQKPKFRYPHFDGVTASGQSNVISAVPIGSTDTVVSSPNNTSTNGNEMCFDTSLTVRQELPSNRPELKNALDEPVVSRCGDLSQKDVFSDNDNDSGQNVTDSGRLADRPVYKPSVNYPARRRISVGEASELSSTCPCGDAQRKTDTASVAEDSAVYCEGSHSKVHSVKKKLQADTSRRVQFEPLALLLDAALQGEIDLLQTTLKVCDASAANDEGITALHNAICAGHYSIAEYLVTCGCDVNAPDNDGWTPLHCAASCNDLATAQLLVEHGACMFTTSLSDQQRPSEKCEPAEDNYESCLHFLQDVEEQMRKPGATVYAAFDYSAENADELTFGVGDQLTVMQCSNDIETEWWWCQLGECTGYVPQNLLALKPRKVPSSVAKSSFKLLK